MIAIEVTNERGIAAFYVHLGKPGEKTTVRTVEIFFGCLLDLDEEGQTVGVEFMAGVPSEEESQELSKDQRIPPPYRTFVSQIHLILQEIASAEPPEHDPMTLWELMNVQSSNTSKSD